MNLSFILQPWLDVAAIVVSDINERLSPKKAPPITIPNIRGSSTPKTWDKPDAIGTNAIMVPTLVPIARLMIQADKKSPARINFAGNIFRMK